MQGGRSVNLKTLWYFLWIGSSGGVSAAARHLGLAQSTLSGALGALQAELGANLFEATALGPRPTRAALLLRDYAAWLVMETEQAFADLHAGNVGPLDPIQVSAHGVPRCSVADWATTWGMVDSAARNGPRGVLAATEASEAGTDGAVSVRYRLRPPDDGTPALEGEFRLADRWLAVSQRRPQELTQPIWWNALSSADVIAPALSPSPGEGFQTAGGFQPEIVSLDPAGVHFGLLDRGQAILLVPSTMLPAGLQGGAGLGVSPVSGAPLVPTLEIAVGRSAPPGTVGLARAIFARLHRAISALEAGAPRLRTLDARVDLHTLRCFAATMEKGSASRAAQACFIVQPALSLQLKKLEGALARQLFHRSSGGMSPTHAGQRLHSLVEPILADHATALERLKEGRWSGRRRGRVRLGLIPAANEDSLIAEGAAEALAAWRGEFPDTPISVAEGYTSVLLRWLRMHLIDAAIIDTTEDQPGLELTPIFRETITLIFAPGSVWDTGEEPVEGARLSANQLVIPSKRFGLRALFDRAFADAGVSMEPGLEVDSMAVALRLVRSGHWATILPPSAVHRHLREGTLLQRPLIHPSIDRRLCAATRARSFLGPEMQSLLFRIDNAFRIHMSSLDVMTCAAKEETELFRPPDP